MDCPICQKKGIDDFTKKEMSCPQCDADLSVYKLIHDLENSEETQGLFSLPRVVILVLIIAVSAFAFNAEKNNSEKLNVSITELKSQLNAEQLRSRDLQYSIDVLNDSLRSPRFINYVIQKGDSPWIIAKRFYGNPLKFKVIQLDNNLDQNSKFHPGLTLKIRIE